jgi:hypothetical protein
MKIYKYIAIGAPAMVFAVACNKGIDPISAVAPGPDTASPAVTINYPIEGTKIRVDEPVTSMTVKFVAADDIELKSISVKLDGTEINNFSSFKDYRRYMGEFVYNNVTNGEHALSVVATDVSGKETTQTVNFKKIPAYVPMPGEVFYLPLDGDYFELVGKKNVTVVKTPGFVAGKLDKAYAGATDAYMTYPTAGLLGSEFSIAFWYNLSVPPPKRAGIFSISRPYTVYADSVRFKGFRIFREDNGTSQNIGLNMGIGKSEVWVNPFITVKSTGFGTWMHFAISVSGTLATVYIDGVSKKTAKLTAPLSWAECTSLTIASGVPNFTFWEHLSDLGLYDEIHIYNKAITQEEVTALFSVKK